MQLWETRRYGGSWPLFIALGGRVREANGKQVAVGLTALKEDRGGERSRVRTCTCSVLYKHVLHTRCKVCEGRVS